MMRDPVIILLLAAVIFGIYWLVVNFYPTQKGGDSAEEKLRTLNKQARIEETPIKAKWKTKRAEGALEVTAKRAALAESLGALQRAKQVEELRDLEAEWNILVKDEEMRNQQASFQKATEAGMPADVYSRVKEQEGLAQVELLKHQGLKDIDWEFLEKEHNLKLKGALFLAIREHREMQGLTEMFELLVRRRHQIETGDDPEPVKQKLLERYDRNIEILDGYMNGKGNRLLQEVDGENA